ncbi:MAG: DoxX family protein [Thermoflavifilum sp.]|nr:DoxX family protein [Thermoflavifilum sp.]
MVAQRNRTKAQLVWGWIISGIIILFCLFDVLGKFMKPEAVVKGTIAMGYPESTITPIGAILLICTLLYAIPSTSLLGAVLLTGYLGGAVASNLRMEAPLFSQTLVPVYFGIVAWIGVYLRSKRLRRLLQRNEA